jgi:2-hydroxychromene-2-carboxylate isomerase
MVQILPDIASRFAIDLRPLVVEKLPANMYPDPARYEAYTIVDASRLARLYGLGFSAGALVPDRLAVGMANRFLASRQNDPKFFAIAEEIGAALWRQDVAAVRQLCGLADLGDEILESNEVLLKELGHYASASLYYGGEFYVGLDRLDHLERRLNGLGLGDENVEFEVHRLWRYGIERLDRSPVGEPVDVYFSVRSPYSYLGLQLISELQSRSGVKINLKPVLPMLMRGMKVPPTKSRYIIEDTAREARLEGYRFGNIVDPLGAATWRAMEIGFAILRDEQDHPANSGQSLAFFKAFTKAVWAEGIDGTTDKGLKAILSKAGLSETWVGHALSRDEVNSLAEANREDMFRLGSWGVPTFHVAGETVWGQDRMWAIVSALQNRRVGVYRS